MRSPRTRVLSLFAFALLCADAKAVVADTFPEYLPTQYQALFARYVDSRSLPERMLNAGGLTTNDYGRGFALVAGISKYPRAGKDGDLRAAAEDVRKLVNYLTTYEKFDEIVVLKDADVTEANLSFFLQRYFPRRLQTFPKSRFLFAYSGHGVSVNNRSYILTPDAESLSDTFNSIPMATLRAMFQNVVDSGHHVLALINACYSGDFLRRSFGDGKRFIPKYPGAHAITAGGTKELTWHDGKVGTGSVFFEKLYAALDGRAGRDGIITIDELAAYLKREVQISTDQQQNPLPGDLSRDGSLGGFFFLNRLPLVEAKVVPVWDAAKGVPFGTSIDIGNPASTRLAAIISEAYARLNGGEYDRAIVGYSEAISLDPKFGIAYNSRGIAYTNKKDYDRAIADFSEAIRLDPKYANAYHNRGVALDDKHEYDRAIADFSEAIRLDPKYVTAYNHRGLSYKNKKDYDRAIADFSEAIRLDPKYAFAYNNRGIVYKNSKNDYDRAIADYSEAIRLDPKYAVAYNNRGVSYNSKKDYDRAIADFSEAIRLDPKYAFAYNNRGVSYNNKKDYDRAIADYSEAIRLDPAYARAYYNRGLVRNLKGEGALGVSDILRARRLDPSIEN